MKQPKIAPTALVMQGAVVMGDVEIGEDCGIWPNVVLRGDMGPIRLGRGTNIQDGSICHTDAPNTNGAALYIGENVTVGHLCILHGCQIGDGALIGMGSIVMNGAKIGKCSLVGAGSLVTENTVIPDGHLAFGRPAKVQRALTPEEQAQNIHHAEQYVALMREVPQE